MLYMQIPLYMMSILQVVINYGILPNDSAFRTFLFNFCSHNAVKISYASSIGISSLTNIEKNDFKKWLSSYNAISVREKQAQKMLNELLMGKNVFQVSDPTFLLDRDFLEEFGDCSRIIENPIFYFSL